VSAAETLRTAKAAGVRIEIDGVDLILQAAAPPPVSVLDLISRHKTEILAHLRPANDGWSAGDWLTLFEDRLSLARRDGHLSHDQALARAFSYCVVEWFNRHPATSAPDRCLACGSDNDLHDRLIPFGTGNPGYAWLHSNCWSDWYLGQKAAAGRALKALGLPTPADFQDDFDKIGGE
jgi:hypothetical protein